MLDLLVALGVTAVAAYVALLLIAWRFGERLMFPAPASSYRAGSVEGLVTLTASDGTRFAALHLPHRFEQLRADIALGIAGQKVFFGHGHVKAPSRWRAARRLQSSLACSWST